MRLLCKIGERGVITISNCLGQSAQKDTLSPSVIFFDDFDNNKNKWTVADNKYDLVRKLPQSRYN